MALLVKGELSLWLQNECCFYILAHISKGGIQMKTIFTFLIAFLCLQTPAQADRDLSKIPAIFRKPIETIRAFGFEGIENVEYQIGDEWGKKIVTLDSLQNESQVFQKAARRTARFGNFSGSGTAFYLGKFNGKHVIASNYHVIEDASGCRGSSANFTMLKKTFKCKEFIGSWSDVDFALATIDVSEADEAELEDLGQNMAFNSEIYAGQELLTIGHGYANNNGQRLVANQDSDCIVFSQGDDVRYLADPDDKNPADYKVWSFANGCDISHGDSGSAMVDRNTGDILGIIWTGRIPKHSKVQSSAYLQQMLTANSEEIWQELSYAAPSFAIKEILQEYIQKDVPVDTKETIRQILQ